MQTGRNHSSTTKILFCLSNTGSHRDELAKLINQEHGKPLWKRLPFATVMLLILLAYLII